MKKTTKIQPTQEAPKVLEKKPTIFERHFVWFAFAVAMLSFAVYFPAFNNDFTNWDDNKYVVENSKIKTLDWEQIKFHFTDYHMGNYHPLTMITHSLDYYFFKDDATGYIVNNTILYALTCLIVVWLIYALFNSASIALVAGAIFGLHAIHVESVAWVSERKDVLYALFYFLSLWLYVLYVKKNKWFYLGFSLLAFVLSLLSKGQAVSLAVSLVAVDYLFNRKLVSFKVIAEKIPFFILALIFGIIAIKAQASGEALRDFNAYSAHERIIFASYALFGYLWKLVLPLDLSALYPYPFRSNLIPGYFWLYLTISIAYIYAVYISLKKDKRIFFGLAFFAINIGLLLQLIPVGSAVMSDRYALIPSFGFVIAFAFFTEAVLKKYTLEKYTILLISIYLLTLGTLTALRTDVWKNSMVLWTDVIEKQPKAVIGLNNRGALYNQMEKYDLAVIDFTKAVRLKPDYSEAYYNMGSAKKELGLFDEALRDYKTAIKYDEKIYQAHLGLAVIYDEQLKFEEALIELDIALKIRPNYTEALTNKGVILGKAGKYLDAIENFNQVLSFDPENTSALANRGFAKYFLKQYNEAIADLTNALKLDPKFANAYINRGLAYSALNQVNEAVTDFNKAIELDANNSDAYFNVGFVLLKTNKEAACSALKRSMELGNKTAETYYLNNCK